ncbi:MAG: hypothetical protein M3Y68_03115 [Chloroflexota bacterium]|nr:hypothetical protein [Chloroflexota bacterium]
MTDVEARMERVIEQLSGNEALLGMLETEAATEMLNWGIATARSLITRTRELDDFAAELAVLPRLKAIRQSMRAIGNWAAGNYADPASRIELRNKLLRHFRTIFGDEKPLPPPEKMDQVLNQVEDRQKTPHELILRLRQLLEETS